MWRNIKRLFAVGDFSKLFIGQLVSGLGDWLATFAFIALIYSLTGKAADVAIILILRLVPPMLASPVGGVFADRLPRKTIMVAADISRAIIIAFVPFANIWEIYLIAFVHECITLFFLPARDATIPRLAPKGMLEVANGFILASGNGILPVAGALFGVLHSAGGLYPPSLPFAHRINSQPEVLAFFADALTFVWSAAFIASMKFTRESRRLEAHSKRSFWRDFAEGFRAVWRNHEVRGLAYGVVTAMFGGGALFAVGVGYVRQTLGTSSAGFGWLTSLWGVGMAVGLLGIRTLVHWRGRMYAFVAAIFVMSGIIIGMALVPVLIVAYGLAVVFGASFASALMLATTMAQEAASDNNRGTVMGGLEALYNIGLGIGAIGIGALASAVTHVHLLGFRLDGNQVGMLVGGVIICSGAFVVVAVSGRQAITKHQTGRSAMSGR